MTPNGILDKVMPQGRRYTQAEAVVYICMNKRYKDSEKVKTGEVYLSLRKTAREWGWDKDTVARFIDQLIGWGLLENTGKESVYAVKNNSCDTKRDTKRDRHGDINGDTKRSKRQKDKYNNGDSHGDTKGDSHRDTNADTTPIIDKKENKKENKKEKRNGAASASAAPSAQQQTDLPPMPELPVGLSKEDWERFRAWMIRNTPQLMEIGVRPVDFLGMRNAARDKDEISDIMLRMEKEALHGYGIHDVRESFLVRAKEYRWDKLRGIYG